MRLPRYERCTFKGCRALVIASRMPDHWIIAYHYSDNFPAKSIRFPLEAARDVLRSRRAS